MNASLHIADALGIPLSEVPKQTAGEASATQNAVAGM